MVYIIQRDHRSVIQFGISFPKGAGGKARIGRRSRQRLNKCAVVICPDLHVPCPELPHIAFCVFSRGNMEIIRISHRMRRNENNGLRSKLSDQCSGFSVCFVCRGNLLFFPSANLRQDNRRMRDHNRSNDRHGGLLLHIAYFFYPCCVF